MCSAPADIRPLFTQFFQFLPIRDLYRSARQLHHAFVLEIAKHAGNNLTGITHVVAAEIARQDVKLPHRESFINEVLTGVYSR